MINRDSWGHSCLTVRGETIEFAKDGIRPVHLLRVVLFRVLESNFPGDSLSNSTDVRIPTP